MGLLQGSKRMAQRIGVFMDFQLGEREERLRRGIREFVKEEISPGSFLFMFEEESLDEEWDFDMTVTRKMAQKG